MIGVALDDREPDAGVLEEALLNISVVMPWILLRISVIGLQAYIDIYMYIKNQQNN